MFKNLAIYLEDTRPCGSGLDGRDPLEEDVAPEKVTNNSATGSMKRSPSAHGGTNPADSALASACRLPLGAGVGSEWTAEA